ncbi:putative amino acid dehydrogenase [Humibacillus xanthopallidus]|uniref:Putative amino acid dehydrogenase n=1 Tax=Humibacillus xanthopallidus TaxID=412689 RepID=A0A543PKJ6_9MICO|nr:dehydrogenase [Humibacillus xanthopallidus]TQN44583.1 putative amino acid dehydrogenase [Humibacillus xanthopallidus]
MARQAPLVVVHVSLTGPERDYDEEVTFLDRPFRIVRVGTSGDVDAAESLVAAWSEQAAAIAVTGIHEARVLGLYDGDPQLLERIRRTVTSVPVTDGVALRNVLQEWAIRRVQTEMPGFFNNARTVVLGGLNHARSIRILREFTPNVESADPALLDLLEQLVSLPVVGKAADLSLWPVRRLPDEVQSLLRAPGPVSRAFARRAARDCDVVVATYDELTGFGLEDLAGKTVVTSSISDEQLAELGSRGVDLVIDATPQPFEVTVEAAALEAMMLATVDRSGRLADDDLLDLIIAAGLEARLLYPNGPRRKSRFAFVIHPLSQQYFRHVEPLATITKVAPGPVMDVLEKAMAYTPPFTYSHVTGIRSPTGAEAEGWLITVGGTPKELMAHSPEFTYSRLLAAAETARKLGAQVMGLGAFTKVVGDAGVTVAKRAPLPITTGNSYSASGALWAAQDALERLGLVEVDEGGRLRGTAMVVGATGAIGSVCARLLALSSDELWLVSPEAAKLLDLKHDIEREHPRATVHVAATPDGHLGEMDLIVTATSGAGKRVLDIMAVKPGAVITDVARPLDLSAADVAKRPDVLVVQSGEIELPGDVRMRNIGLPDGVAYACLAETVVLALEGRYETFTVGRNIEWAKVKEIYKLGRKHGMKLATISGVNGVFTDDDIAHIRELALVARGDAPARP